MVVRTFPVKITGDPEGDSEPLNDLQWGELHAAQTISGVAGSPGTTDLQAYRTGAGAFVRPGSAWICGVYFDLPVADGDVQVTGITPNTGGTTRLDLLTIRRDLTVDPKPLLTYVEGGATPPPPQYNPDAVFDVPLAVCTMATGGSVPTVVTDYRDFMATGVVPARTVADARSGRRSRGTIVYENDTQTWQGWVGNVWRQFQLDNGVTRRTWSNYRTSSQPINGDTYGEAVGLNLGTAPGGEYEVVAHIRARSASTSSGASGGGQRNATVKLLANGAPIGVAGATEPIVQVYDTPVTVPFPARYSHPGGALTFSAQVKVAGAFGVAESMSSLVATYLD